MKAKQSYTKVCPVCGETFTAWRSDTTFCPKCNNWKAKKYKRSQRKKEDGEVTRCIFCGHPTRGRFCKACRDQGFDDVYEVTGRSNGWDRRVAKARPINPYALDAVESVHMRISF